MIIVQFPQISDTDGTDETDDGAWQGAGPRLVISRHPHRDHRLRIILCNDP